MSAQETLPEKTIPIALQKLYTKREDLDEEEFQLAKSFVEYHKTRSEADEIFDLFSRPVDAVDREKALLEFVEKRKELDEKMARVQAEIQRMEAEEGMRHLEGEERKEILPKEAEEKSLEIEVREGITRLEKKKVERPDSRADEPPMSVEKAKIKLWIADS
ncbi:hypothetical protein EJ08DRAFT_714395 [Tothia fuscella]|uniref:Uncharacterized protein n=1 Tax=Tothia fuscella TaxID=1048955 RepID=A0A9P4TXT8_9PEZI|nr:hypothetical protein EJ08DRAFT_714395 [Tothia fuscella]